MAQSSDSIPAASAVAISIARRHSGVPLPCPVCGCDLKSDNLEKHVDKVHPDEAFAAEGTAAVDGSDNFAAVVAIVVMLALMVGLIPALALDLPHDLVVAVFIGAMVMVAIPGSLAWAGRIRASIAVTATGMTMRYFFGLFRREVRFPLQVETGQLVEGRSSGMAKDGYGYTGPYHDVRVGSYLRFIGKDGTTITVGAKRSTHPRRYWEFDHTGGGKRKMWDIRLTPAELVRLQYLLAEHDVIRPITGRATDKHGPRELQ